MIHKMVFENQFGSNLTEFSEMHIKTALKPSTPSNSLKRVYSVMYLANNIKNGITIEY